MTLSLTLPAPSTLPEEGLDLNAELARYRDWLIEQALFRTGGNRAQAARLLGLNRTTLVEMLKRRDQNEPEPGPQPLPVGPSLWERMDALIAETLEQTGNASDTARQLGIGRTTLYRRLAAHAERQSGVVTELEEKVASHVAGAPEPAPELVSAREEDPVMTHPDVTHEPSPDEPSPAEPEPIEPEPQTLPGTEPAPESEPAPSERPLSEPPTAVHVRSDADPYRVTRARVVQLSDQGLSPRQIASKLATNVHLVDKLLRVPGLAKCGER